jgi:hypothetical protein
MTKTLKKPKWDISQVIDKGYQTLELVEMNEAKLAERVNNEEVSQLKANVTELSTRRSGQKETLTAQKSKTAGQNSAIVRLTDYVMSVRNVVKSNNATDEISIAFGVGSRVIKTVSGSKAAANMIVSAYQNNAEWCTRSGILASDISEIQSLLDIVDKAESQKAESKFTRMAKTMDKNTLQRDVEDEITRISAIGKLVFKDSDPAIADLFENLIPSSSVKTDTKTDVTNNETKA